MSELTAMQRAVLMLLGDLIDRTGSVVAERLMGEIRDGYPIKGENAPQTAGETPEGASEDTREKLEADVRDWQSRVWQAGRDGEPCSMSHIHALLDRQASITERECRRPNWEYCETCETIAKLKAEANALEEEGDELAIERDELGRKVQELEDDLNTAELDNEYLREQLRHIEQLERDSAYMRLPVDADGVPVCIGDTMERVCAEEQDVFTVGFIGADGFCMDDETSFFKASECRHVQPDTVESLLADFQQDTLTTQGEYAGEVIEADEWQRELEKSVEDYAERIRKAVEHD